MKEESFLLVSLEEDKAKQLAQVLSNDTARKILDYLSKVEHATETDISKKMKLPLSTVHYNLQQLAKSNLVSDEHFNYSEKGKKIIHYSLSNKYVIIAPKKTDILKEKIKQFLPVVLITTMTAVFIKYFRPVTNTFAKTGALQAATDTAVEESGEMLARAAAEPVVNTMASNQEFAVWFLFGSMFALLLYFIWTEVVLKKRK
jgi:DNA-binding transcriptional ArsR family regulator